MPQLVKGGKYTFGWSRVGGTGRFIIPPEALEEYRLRESEKLILVMIGPLIPKRRARSLRLGVWVGTMLVAPLSVVFVQAGWAVGLLSLIEGGVAGAAGGRVADKVFGRWYSRYE